MRAWAWTWLIGCTYSSPNRAQRRASSRKRGAQVGHKGSARAMLDESQVDKIIACAPAEFCDCGAPVAMIADEPIRHQVFDVPPVKAQVHEYRRYAGRCTGCGKAHRGALPAGVPSVSVPPWPAKTCSTGPLAQSARR